MVDVLEDLRHLDESLELAVAELARGLVGDEGLRPWSREQLCALMIRAKQHVESARSEAAGLLLLCDRGE